MNSIHFLDVLITGDQQKLGSFYGKEHAYPQPIPEVKLYGYHKSFVACSMPIGLFSLLYAVADKSQKLGMLGAALLITGGITLRTIPIRAWMSDGADMVPDPEGSKNLNKKKFEDIYKAINDSETLKQSNLLEKKGPIEANSQKILSNLKSLGWDDEEAKEIASPLLSQIK